MKNYYDQVKMILQNWAKARDDDMLLYAIFLHMNKIVTTDEKFFDVMSKAKERGIPSYESVTRARRKVQEKEPDLRGLRYQQRKKEEATYHDYYRNH